MEQKCKYCNNVFEFENGKKFGGHLTNCSSNPKKLERDVLSKQKKEYKLNCNNCSKEYIIFVTEHNFKNGKYKKNCSLTCSNKRILNDSVKNKISKTLKKGITLHTKTCLTCKKDYNTKRKNQKFCSSKCFLKTQNLANNGRLGGLKSAESQGKRSKNEILFAELCKVEFDNILVNKPIFNGWDADIILIDFKIAILWNGKWHYEKINKNHSVLQVQNRDKIKVNEIIKAGFTPYVITDLGKYNKNKVIKEWENFKKWFDNFKK
jgi:hypothetical protein